jgi:hypothetical protein
VELAARGSLIMAAITRAYTIARVAELLGEDEDWLHEISIEMDPEDGIFWLYGTDGLAVPAFTELGIESLQNVIREYDANPALKPQRPKPIA